MDLGVGDVFAAVGFGCWAGEHAFEGFHFFLLLFLLFFTCGFTFGRERNCLYSLADLLGLLFFFSFNAVLAGGAVSVTVASAVAAS